MKKIKVAGFAGVLALTGAVIGIFAYDRWATAKLFEAVRW